MYKNIFVILSSSDARIVYDTSINCLWYVHQNGQVMGSSCFVLCCFKISQL